MTTLPGLLSPFAALAVLLAAGCATVAPSKEAVRLNQLCEDRLQLGPGSDFEAETYCNQALRLSPHYAAAWANRGTILLRRGQPEQAIECFDAAAYYDGKSIPARRGRGLAAFQQGAYEAAGDAFAEALALDPADSELRYDVAVSRYFERSPRRAKPQLQYLLDIAPAFAPALHLMAVIQFEEGAVDEARQLTRRALAQAPQVAAHWLTLAAIYQALGRRDDAQYALTTCALLQHSEPDCQADLTRLAANQPLLPLRIGGPKP